MRTLLLLLLTATQLPAQNSRQSYESLAKDLRDAKSSQDFPAFLAAAKNLQQLLNNSPESLLRVARAQLLNNNLPEALHALQQFAAMGQSSGEVLSSPDFAPLRALPEFAAIQSAMNSNQTPVTRSTTAFSLPSLAGLVAEDVAFDSATKHFYFTTVLGKKIFDTSSGGQLREFASAPGNWPFLAIKIDSARKRLWATAVALRDFNGVPAADQGKSAILCYDIPSGKLLRRIDGPPGSALGDFTLSPGGDLILSDNEGGGIFSLNHDASILERLDKGDFVSPQTPALAADNNLIFIPDYARGIAVLNRATRQIRWLDSQNKFALSGIDGLYFTNGKLLAVQNGTSPERVTLFTLDQFFTRITAESVIERSTATLGDPTHGVLVVHAFYYIANSGWDTLDDHGNPRTDARPSAPHLMLFPLPN